MFYFKLSHYEVLGCKVIITFVWELFIALFFILLCAFLFVFNSKL